MPSTAETLFARAREDTVARAVVEATLTEIAYHLTNLVIALDPERVALGGGLMAADDLICRASATTWRGSSRSPRRLSRRASCMRPR